MGRITLFALVCAACLLAVSLGVGQSPNAPLSADQPPSLPPNSFFQSVPPTEAPAPREPRISSVPTDSMTVKVYSVPDLVAAVQVQHAAPSLFGAPSEFSHMMEQVQLQVQAVQASVQAALPTGPADEVAAKLERLKKALQVAAPKRSWEDGGGDGEIEAYPDALCLIVRQTASGHEAIADLLSQLRATQDVQIELAVEVVTLHGVADDIAAEAMQLLNKELSAEELAQFRKCGAQTAMSGVVRMTNGRSANANLTPLMPLYFTAVASADQSTVEFRTDFSALANEDGGIMLPTFSQSRTVAAGKTLAFMIDGNGTIVLVTPKVVEKCESL